MENNKELFELITKMYSEFTTKMDTIHSEMQDMKSNMATKDDIAKVESKVDKLSIKVEQDIEPKIQSLFDGYSAHTEQLNRIEDEVARHDEVIIRRVK